MSMAVDADDQVGSVKALAEQDCKLLGELLEMAENVEYVLLAEAVQLRS